MPLDDVPSPLLRPQWQGSVLTRRRQTVQTQARKRLVEACSTRERHGVVTNVPPGEGPSREERLARYLATDVGSPPLARRRIDGDDGHQGTSHSRAHTSARVARATGEVDPFRGRMRPHGCAQGFNRRRS